jgi:hypothetical protein
MMLRATRLVRTAGLWSRFVISASYTRLPAAGVGNAAIGTFVRGVSTRRASAASTACTSLRTSNPRVHAPQRASVSSDEEGVALLGMGGCCASEREKFSRWLWVSASSARLRWRRWITRRARTARRSARTTHGALGRSHRSPDDAPQSSMKAGARMRPKRCSVVLNRVYGECCKSPMLQSSVVSQDCRSRASTSIPVILTLCRAGRGRAGTACVSGES